MLEQDCPKSGLVPSSVTGILKTSSSGIKFCFQLKDSTALHCCPDTSKELYALLPLGEKTPKSIPVATSNP